MKMKGEGPPSLSDHVVSEHRVCTCRETQEETGKVASDYSVAVSTAANRRHIANSSREPPVNIRY